MSKKTNTITAISARIWRLERKCDRLISEVRALRNAVSPQPAEIDEVIGRLRDTAAALREQSVRERQHYARFAREG